MTTVGLSGPGPDERRRERGDVVVERGRDGNLGPEEGPISKVSVETTTGEGGRGVGTSNDGVGD